MKVAHFLTKHDRRAFFKMVVVACVAVFVMISLLKTPALAGGEEIPQISILYYTNLAEQDDIWKLVTQDWKKLGLDFKLNVASYPVCANAMYNKRDYGHIGSISFGPTNERLDPSYHLEQHFHSSRTSIGSRNYGYYVNPEYDKYCDLQKKEMDENKRREYVFKCQEILAKDIPAWYMAYSANVMSYNSQDWEGVVPMPGAGIGGFLSPWTYLNIQSKTGKKAIRVAHKSEYSGNNPFRGTVNITAAGAQRFIFDTYVKVAPDLKTVPWAAESWKVVDGTTVDIKLRPGMKFHDGKPVTVEDVKFSWDYTKKWKFPLYNWVSETVKKTEILDDRTVRFHLVKPHAPFVNQVLVFAIILPKHIWEKIPESEGLKSPLDWDNPEGIGSGPFKFVKWRKGESVTLAANKEHWSAPKIDTLHWRTKVSPDAMVSALIAKEIDIIGGDIRLSMAKEFERYNYITTVKNPSHRLWMARPDMRKKPFDDLVFRRALYTAIDYKKIHMIVFEGAGHEGRNTPISPVFTFWHNPNIPPPKFSIEGARKMLKDAGYTWNSKGRLCFPEK